MASSPPCWTRTTRSRRGRAEAGAGGGKNGTLRLLVPDDLQGAGGALRGVVGTGAAGVDIHPAPGISERAVLEGIGRQFMENEGDVLRRLGGKGQIVPHIDGETFLVGDAMRGQSPRR